MPCWLPNRQWWWPRLYGIVCTPSASAVPYRTLRRVVEEMKSGIGLYQRWLLGPFPTLRPFYHSTLRDYTPSQSVGFISSTEPGGKQGNATLKHGTRRPSCRRFGKRTSMFKSSIFWICDSSMPGKSSLKIFGPKWWVYLMLMNFPGPIPNNNHLKQQLQVSCVRFKESNLGWIDPIFPGFSTENSPMISGDSKWNSGNPAFSKKVGVPFIWVEAIRKEIRPTSWHV